MMPTVNTKDTQCGASLLAAIFLIVVVGFFGLIVVSLVSTQNIGSLNEIQSTQAFYVAEAGMEQAVSYLLGPTLAPRTTCAGLPVAATSLNPGQFQLNTEAGSPFYSAAATTIPAGPGVTSAATTIPVVSTANYAPFGRIMIDRELIDYTGTTANSFTGALRGRDGTLATSHLAGTRVGQSQCTVTSTGGVTDLTATARGRRVERAGIQLQEAWAVGDNGVILRWNGLNWVQFATTNTPLRGVSMDSYANGWAVGDAPGGAGARSQVRRWNPDGTPSWDLSILANQPPNEATVSLNAVQVLSHNEAWAVGNDRGGPPNSVLILRWNGAGWTFFDSFRNQHLYALSMIDVNNDGRADDGWAAGNRRGCINPGPTILHWNGANWSCPGVGVLPNTGDQHLRGIFMVSTAEGWAVGDRRGCGNPGPTFLRYAAGAWTCAAGVISVPVANQADVDLYGIAMLSANDGWAVGATGGGGGATCPTNQARILRWDGGLGIWNCVPSLINQHLRAVACATSNDCWAVGDAGSIVHWDGNAWTVHPQSGVVTNQNLRSVHIIGPRGRPQAVWREVVS